MTRRKILLIDDEAAFTRLVRLNLERLGTYEVREENDPVRGLATAREFVPDLVLLDVLMPAMDGGDVARQLHADPLTRDIPVIFLTCLVPTQGMTVGKVISAGHAFLPKPANIEDMLAIIEAQFPPEPSGEEAPPRFEIQQ